MTLTMPDAPNPWITRITASVGSELASAQPSDAASDACRSRAMVGNATLAIAPSSMASTVPSAMKTIAL